MQFPYDKKRPVQEDMIKQVETSLKNKKFMLIHAPTGLGKTAASLMPALNYAIENNKTIFFLTSRHTQQKIVFETIHKINEKNDSEIQVVGVIGKKNMCSQQNVEQLNSGDFAEYCKALTSDKLCTFYENSRKKAILELVTQQVKNKTPEELIKVCKTHYLCPYEITMQLARTAKLVISDYYYLFNPFIRQTFFSKINKELKDAVVIIDEAHNLAGRLRKLWSTQLSNKILVIALKEAKKYNQQHLIPYIQTLIEDLNKISDEFIRDGERMAKRSEISLSDKKDIAEEFEEAAKIVLEDQKRSAFNAIASFLNTWEQEIGYSRILRKEGDFVILKHNCIDAAILTKDVFEEANSVLAMSGTLLPLEMYADLLGFPRDTVKENYPCIFPDENRLALVVPKTTTKYAKRSEEQYKNIAKAAAMIANSIPGNVAIFFPSYRLRDSVLKYFESEYENNIFLEQSGMSKEEKEKLLSKFKISHGALLGVAAGSFGEGIDMPGILKGVIVVGLPLEKPNLETQQKIQYYEDKFKKGWDYGYVLPAITTCFQNVGRCIRTERDKGVLVFLDERFSWPMYAKSFPKDWKVQISVNPVALIEEFF